MSDTQKKPALLLILDGWGYREESQHNAIFAADTPVWDRLWTDQPHTLVRTSGLAVGLPEGQMGNSEVGHMNLGAGRVVYQSLTRIDKAIQDGEFFSNPVLARAIDSAATRGAAVHVFGLLSPGGIHSHEDQIFAAIDMAHQRGAERIYLHAFLDGRDTPPRSALDSLRKAEAILRGKGDSRIASLAGRFFAMDRDQRWDRVQPAYDLLTLGEAPFRYPTAESALAAAYSRDEDDEFVQPTVIAAENQSPVTVADGDCVIFMNFRADRARQLTRAFVDPEFSGFTRQVRPQLADFVTLTQGKDLRSPARDERFRGNRQTG